MSNVYTYIAIENGDLQWIYPLKMVIFHGYVSLPEGTKGDKWGYNPTILRSVYLSITHILL